MKEDRTFKKIFSDISFLWQFSLDDFKGKYAGSFAGAAWAVVQPLTTIVLYWFVFQKGFRSQPVTDVPFILWLIAGLLPWLFFSDVIANTTPSMVEYSYLVKKVKFNIDILPLVKIISGVLVHLILVAFMIGMFIAYGFKIDRYYLQIPYYLLYMLLLLAGISYFVNTLYVFFRDTVQIVAILLQVCFWTTPIVWSIDIMSGTIQRIVSKTPFYYMVTGYRDIFVNKKWFFEYGVWNIYFWGIAILVFIIGITTFNKCRKHFADVL